MKLFFDTETTGLPISRNARNHDLKNWPRLVQLAWVMTDDDCNIRCVKNNVIIPIGFTIPKESSDIHGISEAVAINEGIPLFIALGEFSIALDLADELIGHGVYFDKSVVGAEYIRAGQEEVYQTLKGLPRTCTMQKSTKYCKLPKKRGSGYKWPKLQELHVKLFSRKFDDAHDAINDVLATVACYKELKELKVL